MSDLSSACGEQRLLATPRRLLHVVRVLARHRVLGALLGRRYLPAPRAVREAIEELGPTFIKFGQVLAMQRGLLPDAYLDDLSSLHDRLPAMPIDSVRDIVEGELGAPLESIFASFGQSPIGAASIAQVHDATLLDGRRVAVKVQRPGLAERIAGDIAALSALISLGERCVPRLRALELPAALREFAAGLQRETNFACEASSLSIFRNSLAAFDDVWIPAVISECTRGAVLTMDYSNGTRIDAYAREHPEAMPQAVDALVRLMMQTIFEDGLFHADPHPGNVFILPDGRLSLLDFGSTGELDEAMRDSLALLLEAVIKGDARAATEAYLEMTHDNADVNRVALLNDIKAALYDIRRSSTGDVSLGNAFDALVRAGTRNGVHNPGEFVQLTRAVVILEALIRGLAPGHDYMQSFRAQYARLTAKSLSATRVGSKTGKFVRDVARLLSEGPDDARRILHRVAEGDLGRLPRLEAAAERLDGNARRLSSAIVCGALLISGSLLSLTPHSAHHAVGGLMTLAGLAGIVISVVGGARRVR